MSFDHVQTASVIRYPFLWHREFEQGETEGRKPRPTVVAVRLVRPSGEDVLVLLPITSKPPSPGRKAVEIPKKEKRMAGLQADLRLWIVLDEYNLDFVGKSYYLSPEAKLGRFSKAFFGPVAMDFVKGRETAKGVNRKA